MHALAEERIIETEALEKVVDAVEKYLSGEMVIISMR
jgi:hypothetical protein